MDGTETKTRQIVKGIDLWNALQDDNGKISLTNYALKPPLILSQKF